MKSASIYLLAGLSILQAAAFQTPARAGDTGSGTVPVSFKSALTGSPPGTGLSEKLRKPSPGAAFLFSVLVPGTGEWYAGSPRMAKIFLGSEALLWSAYFSFRVYGNWKKHDYGQWAAAHAGLNPSGKDHDFFIAVEDYDNLRAYNEAKLQQRRLDLMYPEGSDYEWDWDTDASRGEFEKLRLASDGAYNKSLFVIGGIVINHIISGIDAVRLAKKSRGEAEKAVHMGVAGLPEGGALICLWKGF